MTLMPLGRMLRKLRHTTGLTLEALAERSGVSVRTISDIERGRSLEPQSRTVRALADALGVTGPDRAALHEVSRTTDEPVPDEPAPLCLLPPDLPDFVGRDAELTRIAGLLAATPPATVVISGSGGLGKTVLAVRAASTTGVRFADGRLFADLRGLDDTALDPYDLQERLLRALGTEPDRIPADPGARRDALARTLTGRRVLLVLDNARDEAQVRPLLPPGSSTSALITSRRALTGLAGATHVRVGPLTDRDAVEMLRAVVRAGAGADEDLHRVARLCGNYPLALRIAGSRLLTRPGWTLATLSDRLADPERRLDRLSAGDLQIRATFALSYDRLDPADQLVFRRLALIPGPDADAGLVAAAAGIPVAEVENRLDELAEAGLVLSRPGRRAGLHDLIRLFARDQLRRHDSAVTIRAADDRVAGRHPRPAAPP
jgi:transcriptional regulator with XRE-family HTH domain